MERNQKAFELWEAGEHTTAIEILFEEIEENPNSVAGYYNLANMLLIAKKELDAKAVLELANEKNPNHPEILYAFGTYYYQIQDYPQALHAFLQVSTMDSYLKTDSFVMLAQSYLALEQPQKALAFLLTAEIATPDDGELLLLIGNTFMQIESFKEAKVYFDKATKAASTYPEAWFKRGLMALVLEEEAVVYEADFEKVRELDDSYYQKQMKQLAEIQAFIKKNN